MGFFKYKFEFTKNNLTQNIISWFESKKEEDKNSYLIDFLNKISNNKIENKIEIENQKGKYNKYDYLIKIIEKIKR